jgi:hypothetical protein
MDTARATGDGDCAAPAATDEESRPVMKTTVRATGLLGALLSMALVAAAPLAAQASEISLDREHLTAFARVHRAIDDARDEFHGKVGRLHDEEGRRRAREELDSRLDGILEGAEMTRERYDEYILAISLDGAARTLFDDIVRELEEEG